jgi:hypothetical protein
MATLEKIGYQCMEESPWSAYCDLGHQPIQWADQPKFTGALYVAGIILDRGVKVAMVGSDPNFPAWPHLAPHRDYLLFDFPTYKALHLRPKLLGTPPPSIDFLKALAPRSVDERVIGTTVELAGVFGEINRLAFQVEKDAFGLVRPSYHAYKTCMQILLAMVQAGEVFKPSDIATDRDGAIRISWAANQRESEIVFPCEESEPFYMYYSAPNEYGTEESHEPEALLRRIRWAMAGE